MEYCCENCKYFRIENIDISEGQPKGYCSFLHSYYENNLLPREVICPNFIPKDSNDTVPGRPIGGPAGTILKKCFVGGIEKMLYSRRYSEPIS